MVITLTNSGVSRPLGAPFRVDDAVTVAFSPQVAAGPPSHFHGSSGIASGGYIQPPSHGPLPCALERGKRPAGRVCGGVWGCGGGGGGGGGRGRGGGGGGPGGRRCRRAGRAGGGDWARPAPHLC